MALQFSIQMPNATDARSWTERVRRIEDLGAYSMSIPDHLGPSLPQLAPMVALAAAAAVTTRLRLATTVLDNDFRHPAMLAKESATLDLLSDGRLDLGVGVLAGWRRTTPARALPVGTRPARASTGCGSRSN